MTPNRPDPSTVWTAARSRVPLTSSLVAAAEMPGRGSAKQRLHQAESALRWMRHVLGMHNSFTLFWPNLCIHSLSAHYQRLFILIGDYDDASMLCSRAWKVPRRFHPTPIIRSPSIHKATANKPLTSYAFLLQWFCTICDSSVRLLLKSGHGPAASSSAAAVHLFSSRIALYERPL